MEKERLISLLGLRFDYYSARAVLNNALDRLKIEDAPIISPTTLARFCSEVLAQIPRTEHLVERIQAIAQPTQAAPPTATPVKTPEPKPRIAKAPKSQKPEPKPAPVVARKEKPKSAPQKQPVKPKPAPVAPVVALPPAPPKPKITTVTVTLSVSAANTELGQRIVACGNIEALGAWNLEKALACTYTEGLWQAVVAVEPGCDIELKFVKLNPDGTALWEDAGNHTLIVPTAPTAKLTAQWQSAAA